MIARTKGLEQVWDKFVNPWLKEKGTEVETLQTSVVSSAISQPSSTPAVVAEVREEVVPAEENSASPSVPPKDLKDLITSFDKDKTPWQYKKYSAENALWQGAALRRRAHNRRSNVSLGVCSVDLSGPHPPTPRPGQMTHRNPCHYFLVLTVRPDMTAETCDAATQYENTPEAETAPSSDLIVKKPKPALVYAALLGTKDEAADALKKLLAQINNDHANYPNEIIFRVHSDQGGEFTSKELKNFLIEKGMLPTTTAGYDPNANPAEAYVGILKRRARYLLGGCRLPTNWWGVAILASAQLCRADAGLEEYPRIPFGTRVMVVKDPPPRDAFMPRAEPATIFGPCEYVSGASWTYQHGVVKARTNIQPQGMSDDDLTWVKTSVSSWDAPDAPLPIPPAQLFDATALATVAPIPDGATRETATCPACICQRRKQKITTRHTLVWGECLKATPPPPLVEGSLQEVQASPEVEPESVLESIPEENETDDVEESVTANSVRVSKCTFPSMSKLLEFPHACVALSDVATWGSLSSGGSATDVPSTSDELSVCEDANESEFEFNDDFAVYGGTEVGVTVECLSLIHI